MYEFADSCKDCAFQALAISGVESKELYADELSGRKTVLTRMAPGAVIPKHKHTHVDETVYVLEGDFVEEGVSYGPGSYFVGKAGTAHGPHASTNGCLVLTHWTGGAVDFIECNLD